MTTSEAGESAADPPPGAATGHHRTFAERGSEDLVAGLADVLAPMLVSSAGRAKETLLSTDVPEVIADVRGPESGATVLEDVLPVVATALAGAAVPAVASALTDWLHRRGTVGTGRRLPSWLDPNIDESRAPVVSTMTEFAHDRSRLVRTSIDERRPVLLSRHGTVVAAIVPLREGAYEEAEYREAALRLHAERQTHRSGEQAPELDEKTIREILDSPDPVAAAARHGVDTSGLPAAVRNAGPAATPGDDGRD